MRVNLSVQRGRRASIFLSSSLRPLEINSTTARRSACNTRQQMGISYIFLFISPPADSISDGMQRMAWKSMGNKLLSPPSSPARVT